MDKIKVAIIGTKGYPYVYGGYETFVKELSERLIISGFDVTIYCHKSLFPGDRPRQLNGITLRYVWGIETKSLGQLTHSFIATIKSCFSNYDILLYVNSANGPMGLLTRLFSKRTVINVDGLEWLRPKWRGLGAKYFYWSSRMSTKWFDCVVTDSFEMEKIYLKEFNKRSEVIAYGANIRFSREPDRIKQYNIEKNQYYLVVGRLIPDNNSNLIIREFTRSKSIKNLVIVGDVPYKDSFAQQLKLESDTRVIFTGYVNDQDDLAELYHNSFAYIHGHQYGGTNPAMLKALANGCSILALDTVFNQEMLDKGKYGLFFNKEEESLKNLIESVEVTPENLDEFRNISRKRIEDNYTWEKICNQYIDLFKKLVPEGSH